MWRESETIRARVRVTGHVHEKRRILAQVAELPRVARISTDAVGLKQGEAMSGHFAGELCTTSKPLHAFDDALQ